MQALLEHASANFGRIDVLVCHAATNPYFEQPSDIPGNGFRKISDNAVNFGNFLIGMANHQMRTRRDGSFTIASPAGGLAGSPVIGAYDYWKAADIQLARNLAAGPGSYNIR